MQTYSNALEKSEYFDNCFTDEIVSRLYTVFWSMLSIICFFFCVQPEALVKPVYCEWLGYIYNSVLDYVVGFFYDKIKHLIHCQLYAGFL